MLSRIVIYLSDHKVITGKSQRQAQRDWKKILVHFKVTNVNYISISQYINYTKLDKNDVETVIKHRN